jgi:hypothetical protein
MEIVKLSALLALAVVAFASPALAHNGLHGPHHGEVITVEGTSLELVETNAGSKGTFEVYVSQLHKTIPAKVRLRPFLHFTLRRAFTL